MGAGTPGLTHGSGLWRPAWLGYRLCTEGRRCTGDQGRRQPAVSAFKSLIEENGGELRGPNAVSTRLLVRNGKHSGVNSGR